MNIIETILLSEQSASDQAKAKGLVSVRFGQWAKPGDIDPATKKPRVAYRTVNGQLVPVAKEPAGKPKVGASKPKKPTATAKPKPVKPKRATSSKPANLPKAVVTPVAPVAPVAPKKPTLPTPAEIKANITKPIKERVTSLNDLLMGNMVDQNGNPVPLTEKTLMTSVLDMFGGRHGHHRTKLPRMMNATERKIHLINLNVPVGFDILGEYELHADTVFINPKMRDMFATPISQWAQPHPFDWESSEWYTLKTTIHELYHACTPRSRGGNDFSMIVNTGVLLAIEEGITEMAAIQATNALLDKHHVTSSPVGSYQNHRAVLDTVVQIYNDIIIPGHQLDNTFTSNVLPNGPLTLEQLAVMKTDGILELLRDTDDHISAFIVGEYADIMELNDDQMEAVIDAISERYDAMTEILTDYESLKQLRKVSSPTKVTWPPPTANTNLVKMTQLESTIRSKLHKVSFSFIDSETKGTTNTATYEDTVGPDGWGNRAQHIQSMMDVESTRKVLNKKKTRYPKEVQIMILNTILPPDQVEYVLTLG